MQLLVHYFLLTHGQRHFEARLQEHHGKEEEKEEEEGEEEEERGRNGDCQVINGQVSPHLRRRR